MKHFSFALMWLGSAGIASTLFLHGERCFAGGILLFGLYFCFAIYGDTTRNNPS